MAINTEKELRGQLIYQVFPRNHGDGTLCAIREDLPRIKTLGADILYLLPVQPSGRVRRKGSKGSPYAIRDYRAVDPALGTMEDFIRLTDAAHEIGLKVMLDVVYNHTSPDSVLAQEHPEWFYHKKDGSLGNRIGDWWDVIDLDYSSKELWDYQIETLKMWAQYVDGFRCDVAPLLPLEFWKEARSAVSAVRPDCLWLAESVEPALIIACRKEGIPMLSDGELYQVFDILYDYGLFDDQQGAMLGTSGLGEYLSRMTEQEALYPDNYCKLRCLENHDRPRAAALVPRIPALRSWTAWILFAKGTAMIYAGEEFCAKHHPTLFDPDPIALAGQNSQEDLSGLIAAMSRIRKDPALWYSSFRAEAIGANRDVIAAVHEVCADADIPRKKVYGFFPLSGKPCAIRADLPDGTYTDALSGKALDIFEKILCLDGEPVVFSVPLS